MSQIYFSTKHRCLIAILVISLPISIFSKNESLSTCFPVRKRAAKVQPFFNLQMFLKNFLIYFSLTFLLKIAASMNGAAKVQLFLKLPNNFSIIFSAMFLTVAVVAVV